MKPSFQWSVTILMIQLRTCIDLCSSVFGGIHIGIICLYLVTQKHPCFRDRLCLVCAKSGLQGWDTFTKNNCKNDSACVCVILFSNSDFCEQLMSNAGLSAPPPPHVFQVYFRHKRKLTPSIYFHMKLFQLLKWNTLVLPSKCYLNFTKFVKSPKIRRKN